MKLPIVTEETFLKVLQEAKEGKYDSAELAAIVMAENPQIAHIILGGVENSTDKKMTLYSGLMTYFLLKRQLEQSGFAADPSIH